MADLRLICGTQLIVHDNRVYKLKLSLPSTEVQEYVWQEVESVLRALLHNSCHTPKSYIQTKHLLCDCTLKDWKAGRRLAFKQNGVDLACPGLQISIEAELKTPSQYSGEKTTEKPSSKLSFQHPHKQHHENRNREEMHMDQKSGERYNDGDLAAGDGRNVNQTTKATIPSSRNVHSKNNLDSQRHTNKEMSSHRNNQIEMPANKDCGDAPNTTKVPQSRNNSSDSMGHNKNASSHSQELKESTLIDKRQFYTQHRNYGRGETKDFNNQTWKTAKNAQTSKTLDTKQYPPRYEDNYDIHQASSKIVEDMSKKKNVKRKHEDYEPLPQPKRSSIDELGQSASKSFVNAATMDLLEREEERKLQNLANFDEKQVKRGWLGRTWNMVLTPVKAVFRRGDDYPDTSYKY